jgi:hypothetical protein
VNVRNNNRIQATNSNHQSAWTGEAEVSDNTHGGDAWTGNASNSNSLDASVTVDNSASSAALADLGGGMGETNAEISDTGPHSTNRVETTNTSRVNGVNNNNLTVSYTNTQTASSGDATVTDNTHGGSATTGDATNENMTTLSFDVSN